MLKSDLIQDSVTCLKAWVLAEKYILNMNMAFKILQTVCSGNDAELWKSKLGMERFTTQKNENI